MANRRITLSISDDDWSNIHVIRILLAIGNPYINQIPNYGDVIKLAILTAYGSTSASEDLKDDFLNEKNEYVERITVAGFNRDYSSFMKEWREKEEKRKSRLLSSMLVPRGNSVYTADKDDLEAIEFLRGVMKSKGCNDRDTTDPKIIRKCIRFLFNSPVHLYAFFADAYISSVYGMRIYYIPLKEIDDERIQVSNGKDNQPRNYIIETANEIQALYNISKDSRVLIDFLNSIVSIGDFKIDNIKSLKGKYWSTMGFDFLEMLIGMAVSLRLLFRQDEWVPDLIIKQDFSALDPDVLLLYASEMGAFLDYSRPYSSLYDEELHNSLRKVIDKLPEK
jgi:hypothetical protein